MEDEHEVGVKDFDIPGVTRVVLSPITQKAIGCVVGQNVTSENPWIYIKKEIFEDNLDINEDTSEFLPIKQEILEYPEKDLLLGYDKAVHEESKEFYICVTTDAKDIVLNMLEKEKEGLRQRLKSCVQKTPRKWTSMGSELEINEIVIRNLRPLIEIEIDSKYPLHDTKIKFSMRPVEAAADGCVDLLPGRIPINNVFRRRVDMAIQVAADTELHEVQTNPTYPFNLWTQYHYECSDPQLDEQNINRALDLIEGKSEDLCDMIQVNQFINLHTNDYASLVKNLHVPFSIDTDEVFSFYDVLSCKGKRVSSVCWHPMISGIIAAAYVRSPQYYISDNDVLNDEISNAIYAQNLVLIWSYTDSLKPKLYLQSPREVNCVSFCQYNSNILIGGCTNGQLVIWDIMNKLEEVDVREQLTSQQEKQRVMVLGYMNWIKNVKDIALIQPTVVTSFGQGHKASVTGISWICSDYQITNHGLIEELENGDASIQFFTCGLDGALYLWDLKQRPNQEDIICGLRKISKRLIKQPQALSSEVSGLAMLNKLLIPQYKLEEKDPVSKHFIPITNMTIDCPTFSYTPINPETLPNPLHRTYFQMSKSDAAFEFKSRAMITTSTGQVLKCTWEGYDIDAEQRLSSETFQTTMFQNVHDGPIKVCLKNPFLINVSLTVGGSVFATWNLESTKSPILWRKSKVKYIAGVWSSHHPSVVIIARRDTKIEIWDLSQRTKAPIRVVHLSGNIFIDGFADNSKLHAMKNLCCTADTLGSLRFYKIPDYVSMGQEHLVKNAINELARTENRRNLYKEWLSDWKKKNIIPVEPKKITPSYIYGKRVEEVDIKSKSLAKKWEVGNFDTMTGLKWNIKRKKVMHEIILDKMAMDINLIKEKIAPMEKKKDEERTGKHKLKALLAQKEDMSQKIEKLLCTQTILVQRQEISVSLSDEDAAKSKRLHMIAYENSEPKIMQHIKDNQFAPVFDWKTMLIAGRERRSLLNPVGYRRNTRRQRFLDQNLNNGEQYKLGEKVLVKPHKNVKTSLELKRERIKQEPQD